MRWTNPLLWAFGKTASPLSTARRVPDGMRVYCVGDIHGRDDLLAGDGRARRGRYGRSVVRPCRDGFPGRLRGPRSWLHARGRTTCAWRMANLHDRPGRQSRGPSDGLPGRRRGPRSLAKPGGPRNSAFLWGGCRPGHGWTRFSSSSSGIRGRVSRTPSALSRNAQDFNGHWRLLLLPCRSKTGRAARSPGSQ